MGAASAVIDRVAQTRRPEGRPVGFHRWWSLSFLHWRIPVSAIEALVPTTVTVDTFDGDAWIGLVPFHMTGVRPWWMPALPGVSTFSETNVRTYVQVGGEPGVWFLSLDAASRLAVWIARWRWNLPYHFARMGVEIEGETVSYRSERIEPRSEPSGTVGPGTPGPGVELDLVLGERLSEVDDDGRVRAGSLEHFLIERYLLFTCGPEGGLLRGQVHHAPHPLRHVEIARLDESLVRAAGVSVEGSPDHAVYSEGATVEIFGLKAI